MKREVVLRDAAIEQLETALGLFLTGGDMFSAITLGGAAEEMLGKELEAAGKPHALAMAKGVTASVAEGLGVSGQTSQARAEFAKDVGDFANRARNSLKHRGLGSPSSVSMDPEREARDILERAVVNYYHLTGGLTERMVEFKRRHDPEGSV